MNTILAYLDNMFSSLPKTAEVYRIKQDLLSGMEEKYTELKAQGKTENEAVGIVISEFGNIDELTAELGIISNQEEAHIPELSEVEVFDFINTKRLSHMWIGIGIFLIMLGVSFLITFGAFFEQNKLNMSREIADIISIGGFFTFLAIAISLLIFNGMRLQKFEYLKKGFTLRYDVKSRLISEQKSFASTFRASTIIGVCVIVLSPMIILSSSLLDNSFESYSISLFLMMISCAVFIFVYYGGIKDAYDILLREDVVKAEKEEEKLVTAFNTIIWTCAVAVYLYISFMYDKWDISWLVFVIAAVLSGMSSSVVTLLKSNK